MVEVKQHWNRTTRAHRDPSRTHPCHGRGWPLCNQGTGDDHAGGGGEVIWTGGKGELRWLAHPFLAAGGPFAPGRPRAPTSLIAPTSSPETNLCFSARFPDLPVRVPCTCSTTSLGCDFCLQPATEPKEGEVTGLETQPQGPGLKRRGEGAPVPAPVVLGRGGTRGREGLRRGRWAQEGPRGAQLCFLMPVEAQGQGGPARESHKPRE